MDDELVAHLRYYAVQSSLADVPDEDLLTLIGLCLTELAQRRVRRDKSAAQEPKPAH
jgi:hypothetical protein